MQRAQSECHNSRRRNYTSKKTQNCIYTQNKTIYFSRYVIIKELYNFIKRWFGLICLSLNVFWHTHYTNPYGMRHESKIFCDLKPVRPTKWYCHKTTVREKRWCGLSLTWKIKCTMWKFSWHFDSSFSGSTLHTSVCFPLRPEHSNSWSEVIPFGVCTL